MIHALFSTTFPGVNDRIRRIKDLVAADIARHVPGIRQEKPPIVVWQCEREQRFDAMDIAFGHFPLRA
jgi:hypothetical protein